jgi:hypothetical protein
MKGLLCTSCRALEGTKSRDGAALSRCGRRRGMSGASGVASTTPLATSDAPWSSVPLLLVGAHLLSKIAEAGIGAKVVEIVVAVDVVAESESE